ncbi:MAG: hypothetical protein A2X78_01035 [Gammaproteobacteria bacterium GWE2_37_16]|nr:MAG: hypothetical protein A2X78_01035 [Gammaproteobacteria bacterium GWE2_37_16]
MKQIIAIGGGGFRSEKSNLKIEKYLLAQTKRERPKICLLPQASREAEGYILKFFETFVKFGAEPSWVSLFGKVEDSWKKTLLEQDIIYVGGGNTKSMIALWKTWELDKVLLEAYNKGIILSGSSAGGICWFEQGITDSVWPLGTVEGLGFLEGSFCPHFVTEPERQQVYRDKVNTGEIKPGLALDDEMAAHFIDGKLGRIITGVAGRKALKIEVGKEVVLDVKDISIRAVTVDEILPLRHKVLWSNKAIDFCTLPEDERGLHYGLFLNDSLISCISVFFDINNQEAQFRKFATDQKYQQNGYGTLLLQKVINELKQKQVRVLWCNARLSAIDFYKKLGFVTDGDVFLKDGIQYIKMQMDLFGLCMGAS